MSESAIVAPPPLNIETNNGSEDQSNNTDTKEKSASPSENKKVDIGTKSEDECLVIDDDEESLKEPECPINNLTIEEETPLLIPQPTNELNESIIEEKPVEILPEPLPSKSIEELPTTSIEELPTTSNEELPTTSTDSINEENLTNVANVANVPTISVTKPPELVDSTTDLSTNIPNSTPTLTEALTTNKKPKPPRPRRPAVKKAESQPQQQNQMISQNGNLVATFQLNGQPQFIQIPAGYKYQTMQQPIVTTPSNQPQTMAFRPPGSGYYLQTNNGGLLYVQGTPPQNQIPPQNSNIPSNSTPTSNTSNSKQRSGQQRKNVKDGESQQQIQMNIKQANGIQQNTMMMVPAGYRLQMSQPSTQQLQQIPNQKNSSIKMSGPPNSNQKNSPQIITPSSTISASVSSSIQQPYISSAQNNGGVCYTMRAPTSMPYRPPGPFIIQQANGIQQTASFPGGLVPVSLPPNCQFQIMGMPALNVQNVSPPPTLSPNLAQAPKSPKSSGSKKKKPDNKHNNGNNSTNVTNGMFANESTKFLNNYTTNLPNLSAANLNSNNLSSNVAEEKMEIGDLNDDEHELPPKIECEGHSLEIGQNDPLAQRQRANANFLHAAQRQNQFQQQKLGSQPLIRRHVIDGRTIEEEIPHQKSNSSPTKQRKVGQPPCSIIPNSKDAGKTFLHTFSSTLNKQQIVPQKTQPVQSKHSNPPRPNPANFQPPPIVKPANYQPTPPKESPKKDFRSKISTSPNHQKSKMTSSIEPQRKSRGRPPKLAQTSQSIDSDTSMEDLTIKQIQPKSENVHLGDKPRQKKNREVENLITMDFGPGKTPFETTSADSYTEKILTSRERMQGHVSSYDGRNSRASVSSTTSKTPNSGARRASHRQSSSSNLSPPSSKRPRRDVQRNISYKHSPDFEEEDDDNAMDNESIYNGANGEEKLERRSTPINTCLYCKKQARDPKLPQYCNEECKRRFKKRQRLERVSNNLNTSTTSVTSFKSEPTPSTSSNPAYYQPGRTSVDNFISPTAVTIKIASPHGSERIRCDGTGNGSFEAPGTIRSPFDMANSRELDGLKAMGIKNWDTKHVARWAEIVCGSPEVSSKFLEQEIDGESLLMLEESQFKTDLGLRLGPFMKLMKDLKKIKNLD